MSEITQKQFDELSPKLKQLYFLDAITSEEYLRITNYLRGLIG